jgi:hypothetical protein
VDEQTSRPDRFEIRGQEVGGWSHTLGIEVERQHWPRVLVATYYGPPAALSDKSVMNAPVALNVAGTLQAAAALVRAAHQAMEGPPTLDEARALTDLADAGAQLWAGPVPVLEPDRGDGRARGVTTEWAATHPDGPPDFGG